MKIDAGVRDKQENFVGGLEQKNFRILIDGSERPIAFFAPADAPARITVMAEASPAVYLISNQHLLASYALLDGLSPEDQVALVTYSRAPRVILGFTPDKSAFAIALGQIQYDLGAGQLNFYDSLSRALDWLKSFPGKQAIVLLTTGLDSSSSARWDALTETLRATDAVIYPVALGGALRDYTANAPKSHRKKREAGSAQESASDQPANPLSFEQANRALLSLAAFTGGRAYFPRSLNDFVPIYRQIAGALRHQYVLGIAPEHDGKFHAIAVEVLDASGQPASGNTKKTKYSVSARQGYLAPQD